MLKRINIPTRRRTYNAFVTNESLEDYSIRYAAKSFRKWPEWMLASTALGGISFLALEAIGALLIVNYGFTNALCAILIVSFIIFITGLPITYYASTYNTDSRTGHRDCDIAGNQSVPMWTRTRIGLRSGEAMQAGRRCPAR
jgi:hypothetical protein